MGRGLARVNWNRDGREDFVVSNVDSPAILGTNSTNGPHHFLAVTLVGTRGERTAIGTRLTATFAGRSTTRQLTAGDGYMASNDRRLVIGLGSAEVVDSLRVQWPSGTETTFTNIPADCDLLVVEGDDEPRVLPKYPAD